MMKQIKVRMLDGRERLFPYYVLDHLIKKKGITAFQRGDGWAWIGRDPVRKAGRAQNFSGRKKRFTDHLVKRRSTDL
jgi:hypothetical protein